MLNPEAQAILDNLLKINPTDLNPDQRAFLRARRSYLKKSQLEEYAEVLEAEEEPAKEEQISYPQLLVKAKELGYTGGRVKRPELEQFIADKTDNNPFN